MNWGFPGASISKESACNADPVSIPEFWRSTGEGNGNSPPAFFHGKFHGQRIEEPGGLRVHMVIRVGHDLATKPQRVIDNGWEIYRKGQNKKRDIMKTFEICDWSWRIRERWERVNIWEFSKSDKRCHAVDTRHIMNLNQD